MKSQWTVKQLSTHAITVSPLLNYLIASSYLNNILFPNKYDADWHTCFMIYMLQKSNIITRLMYM